MVKQIMKPASLDFDRESWVKLDQARQYVSIPKLDGIRAWVHDGVLLSYTNKPIPNQHLQALIQPGMEGCEFELLHGNSEAHDFQKTTSVVMSKDKAIDEITFALLDCNAEQGGFMERWRLAEERLSGVNLPWHRPLYRSVPVTEELWEHLVWSEEGTILRAVDSAYKWGRATAKEATFFKIKYQEDTEARCVGWEPKLKNTNEGIYNAAGKLERSSHKAGKEAQAEVGKLILEHPTMGTVAVGSGLTAEQRKDFYGNTDLFLNKLVKFQYNGLTDAGKPRHPVFLGIRHEDDLYYKGCPRRGS